MADATRPRCEARTQGGGRCAAKAAPGDTRCPWHSPAFAERRREWSQRGGHGKSNRERARKALGGGNELTDVRARLLAALVRVENGELEAGPARAMADLARAIVTVSGAADFEERLARLEAGA